MPRNGAVSVKVAAVFPVRVGDGWRQGHAQYSDSELVAGVSAYYLEAAHIIVVFSLDLRQRVARLRKELA